MPTHSPSRDRGSGRARAPDRLAPSTAPTGFLDAWAQLMCAAGRRTLPRRRGRPPRVPLADLLPALIFHVMNGAGTLSDHFFQMFGEPLADSSWSDRRARLPWEIFAELMQRVLRPLATRRRHRDAFWRGWRVVALDGTQFSLTNTPQITATVPKARTRRGPAACRRFDSHCCLRARLDLKPRVIRRLPDGSRLIHVAVREKGRPDRILQWLEVREIRVRVGRKGHRTHELRLWTSLLDARTAPALELAPLYARRWEHELYFRQVKRQLRKTAVLQSHTVDTAAQEIAALVLASALLAAERARAAAGHIPVLHVSFGKVLELVKPMWLMLGFFDDLVTNRQKDQ